MDPYHEFELPYVGMGNNPISLTDPDGGSTDGNPPDRDPIAGELHIDPTSTTVDGIGSNTIFTPKKIDTFYLVYYKKGANYFYNTIKNKKALDSVKRIHRNVNIDNEYHLTHEYE